MLPQNSPRPSMDLEEKQEHCRVEDVAEDGAAATDMYGHALVEVDHARETALRRKIDLYLLPAVVATYLFCFIDRGETISGYFLDVLGLNHDAGPQPILVTQGWRVWKQAWA